MEWSRNPKIHQAAQCMAAGGVIAYPTEAVWGLGCDPFNEAAVTRLLAIKQRPVAKGLIIVAANLQQIGPLLEDLRAEQLRELSLSWPGPTTFLLPHRDLIPPWVTGDHATVAVRVSAHSLVKGLCMAFGGVVVSTSANLAGRPAATNRLTVQRSLGRQLDMITPGAVGSQASPSRIKDLFSGEVIRAGG